MARDVKETLRKEMILEIESVRTRSHTVEDLMKKSLWICRQTEYGINECEREGNNLI